MFNLNDYEDVDTRIHKFYEKYPDGAIHTEEIHYDEKEGVVIFRAMAFRTYVDDKPSSIGYARGNRKDRGVDRDFWYENCETSSIGRCMANLSLSAKGKRASSLEMAKVADSEASRGAKPIRVRTEEQATFLKQNNPDSEIVWDTTIEPPADVMPAFENAVDLITQTFNAQPVPTCKHGQRNAKEGSGAKGAYKGWLCPLPYKRKAEQCRPLWMVLDPSGTWSFRPEDEGEIAG